MYYSLSCISHEEGHKAKMLGLFVSMLSGDCQNVHIIVFGYIISYFYSHLFSFLLLQDSCHQELLKACTWRAQSAKVKINLPPSGCYFYQYAGCCPSIQGQGEDLVAETMLW